MERRTFLGSIATLAIPEHVELMARAFDPPTELTVSEWADQSRFLSKTVAGEPGQYRTSRTPYLREPMDCLSINSPVKETVLIKGAQIGGTEAGNNWMGYIIDVAPGPMLTVLPTVETAKRWSKQRFANLIEYTPVLRDKVADRRARDSGNTILTKEFAGGIIIITGANSAVGLRSMPARYLFFDEVDGYPKDVDNEGDPVALAEVRASTFARKKILKVSTPLEKATSRIEPAYLKSDQRRFFLPCPLCNHWQVLRFDHLRYTPEKEPEDAWYECLACAKRIDERWKTQMFEAGRWVPTRDEPDLYSLGFLAARLAELAQPPTEERAGYHIPSLYSPYGWKSWLEIAREHADIGDNVVKQKKFANTVLGETFEEKGEAPEWRILYDRRETYAATVPRGVLFLTAGADVQKDRIEVEIVGWGRAKENWSIDRRVYYGDTGPQEDDWTRSGFVWRNLDALLAEDFEIEGGGTLPIRVLAIDARYNPQQVYDWAYRHPRATFTELGTRAKYPRTVMPTWGTDSTERLIGPNKIVDAGSKRRGLRVWNMGGPVAKSQLYYWLSLERPIDGPCPPGFCHFPMQYSDDYFQQLTSESIVKGKWVKDTNRRNEVLDCRVGAMFAAAAFGIDRLNEKDWRSLEEAVGNIQHKLEKQQRAEVREAARDLKPVPKPAPPKDPKPRIKVTKPTWQL